jgi:formylglycine-generating enzyme required for sulfatase activity
MRGRCVSGLAAVAMVSGIAACGGETLEPHAEAIVTLHTDMPVPQIVSALRLDLYDEEDGWYESREIATPSAEDWPLSFSLVSRQLDRPTRTLMRLRAYPAGRLRDYRGERYEPLPTYRGQWIPQTLEQLCTEAEEVVPPKTFELRRGEFDVTKPIPQSDCDGMAATSTGVHVRIAQPGKYRFEVLQTYPDAGTWAWSDTRLFLRSVCREPASQLACSDNISSANGFSRLEAVELGTGTYTLFLGSSSGDLVADVAIRIALASEWNQPEAEPPAVPTLEADGTDRTPRFEPQPGVTIDRLALVPLSPGEVHRVTLVLRGACAGSMARLGTLEQPIDWDAAETCVSAEREQTPLATAASHDGPVVEQLVGSFGMSDDCDSEPDSSDVVCIPSGPLLLGDPQFSASLPPHRTVPERVARISRFWIDRTEVTVGRFRTALDDGMDKPHKNELDANPLKMAESLKEALYALPLLCSWSDELKQREDLGIACISWNAARAFCRFAGGDLPTEAQWEYAATAARRPNEVIYPWERDVHVPPTCTQAVWGRLGSVDELSQWYSNAFIELGNGVSGECLSAGFGPLSVTRSEELGDVTPLGIVGMAGGLSEWVLDAAYPYDHPCWRSASIDDPSCVMEDPPATAVRGGSWVHWRSGISGVARGYKPKKRPTGAGSDSHRPSSYLGFRCAYGARPQSGQESSP